MEKLLLRREAATITAKLPRYQDRRTRPGRIDMRPENILGRATADTGAWREAKGKQDAL